MSVLRNVIILASVLIFLFVGQVTTVGGHSMQPGIQPDDRLVVEKVSLFWRESQINEVVVLSAPESEGLIIKWIV